MTGILSNRSVKVGINLTLAPMKIKISFFTILIGLTLSTVSVAQPNAEKSSPRISQSALMLRSNQPEISPPTFVPSDVEPLVLLLSGVAVFIIATTARRRRLSEKQRQ